MEQQLRSWKPRSPSAKLKERLFPSTEPLIVEAPGAFSGRWGWVAPVMGCFLALMAVSGSRSNQIVWISSHRNTDWLSAVTSNQSYAAYIAVGFHSEQNSLQQDPIEWTNRPRSSSQVGSVPLAKTNSLIQ
jgi:hypothetical protein